jgi:redox-sensitive bicupin YhaK (pirin superfamily)
VCELDESRHIEHSVKSSRQIYFVLIEGSASVNGEMLEYGDACEITDESLLSIKAKEKSHFLFIEMGD